MFTTNLKKIVDKRKKRIGRGPGSGKGFHTVGKGQKGQTSRAGYSRNKLFTGGQGRLVKVIPTTKGQHRGRGPVSTEGYTVIRISKLLSKNIFEIDHSALSNMSDAKKLKLVGESDMSALDLGKVVVKSDVKVTNSLKEAIIAKGGKVEEQVEA